MKIILCGCGGKMGKAVTEAAAASEFHEITAGIDQFGKKFGNFPVFSSPEKVDVKADVIIDFSHPANLVSLLSLARSTGAPLVLCTTGYTNKMLEDIKDAAKHIPVFSTRNTSIGVNLMVELSKLTAKILGNDFDVEIVEMHHNQKIDAPSGTALMLAEAVKSVKNEPIEYVFDRSCVRKSRSRREIGIHSIRGGTTTGTHEIIFAGKNETIKITHEAVSRSIFAEGALKAAEFLINKPVGFYDMSDLVPGN